MINAALYNQNIAITIDVADGLIIHGYKNEFSQVVLNLVNNAKDALTDKGIKDAEIVLATSITADFVTLEISDNAGGIDSDVIEHVFEPYFTTKEEGKGTGIGLYMSKMIIEENMDGSLLVRNDELGARFTIVLNLNEK